MRYRYIFKSVKAWSLENNQSQTSQGKTMCVALPPKHPLSHEIDNDTIWFPFQRKVNQGNISSKVNYSGKWFLCVHKKDAHNDFLIKQLISQTFERIKNNFI